MNNLTDFEGTKQFFDSLGILYSQENNTITFGKDTHGEEYDGYPSCDKIDGYNGFYTSFEFDEDGKFLSVGAWE